MGRTTRICRVAPAKLNLALHVLGKRADGYHAIDSVFVHCVDGDELWVEPAEELSLTITGPFAQGLSAGEDNLVIRAARAVHAAFDRDAPKPFHKVTFQVPDAADPVPSGSSQVETEYRPHYGASRGAAITLVKNLPLASGIGGGSADAAAAIHLLVALWELPDDAAVFDRIAAELGSDVPPCLDNWPKRVGGRGTEIEPLYDQAYRCWPVLLVNPGVSVSTAAVFGAWDGTSSGAIDSVAFDAVIATGANDLEASARALAPAIGDVIDLLAAQPGAFGARMSGSGATCLALFGSVAERDAAAAAISAARPKWWQLPTRLT